MSEAFHQEDQFISISPGLIEKSVKVHARQEAVECGTISEELEDTNCPETHTEAIGRLEEIFKKRLKELEAVDLRLQKQIHHVNHSEMRLREVSAELGNQIREIQSTPELINEVKSQVNQIVEGALEHVRRQLVEHVGHVSEAVESQMEVVGESFGAIKEAADNELQAALSKTQHIKQQLQEYMVNTECDLAIMLHDAQVEIQTMTSVEQSNRRAA